MPYINTQKGLPGLFQPATFILGLVALLVVIMFACGRRFNSGLGGQYRYELVITTADPYSTPVTLKNAQILINNKELNTLVWRERTKFVQIPIAAIRSISFSNVGSGPAAGEFAGPALNSTTQMRILAEGEPGDADGEIITCDSIPNFSIVGQESPYVKRVFQNSLNRFDMQEIKFIRRIDLNQAKTKPPETGPATGPKRRR